MQFNVLYPVWDLSCTFKSSLDTKAQLQLWQFEGFFWRVFSVVHFQIITGRKSCFALDAVEGFISSVRYFMHFQIFTGRKSSYAVIAVEGFFLSVSSLMHFQIFTGQKSSIAIMPVQGFLSIVGYFMHSQIFTGCKSFFCNGSSGRVYLQFRFFHALSNLLWTQKLRCSHGSWRVSLSLLLSCFFKSLLDKKASL